MTASSTPHAVRPVALVTGAGSGIGRATAIALSREGYAVALAGRREAMLRATLTLMAADDASVVPRDLSQPGEGRECVRECVRRYGRLDVLVNNAGLGEVVPIADVREETLERAFAINTMAPATMILEAWPTFAAQHAREGRGGCVVNISSMATIDPFAGFFAYAASKAGLNLMAASIAKEGSSIGVRAFALAPGAVETPMLRAAFDESIVPKDQCLAPEDVARAVVACVRGERDQHNGRTTPVLSPAAAEWYRAWVAANPPILG